LPFLIVQLPNFGTPPVATGESGWAAVREAQRLAVAGDRHAGLAVTIDIGDAHNLHPTNKQDVGKRLARAARRVIYGEVLSASGPAALGAVRSGGRVAVEFGGVERGLAAYSHDSPIGFELCAEAAGTCRFAESHIEAIESCCPPRRWASPPAFVTAGRIVRYAPYSICPACRPDRSSCEFNPEAGTFAAESYVSRRMRMLCSSAHTGCRNRLIALPSGS
jgi:hypothetical protein